MIEIKSRWDSSLVLFKSKLTVLKDAVIEAVKSRADLSGADLSRANLSRADLSRANLSRADLYGADLSRANNIGTHASHNLAIARTRILAEGDLIGWKRCLNDRIVKLIIPTKAKRSHAFGRKCRAQFAKVLEIWTGEKKLAKKETATSGYDKNTVYKVGSIVRPDSWDDNWRHECASGIHFYITREEAEAHTL